MSGRGTDMAQYKKTEPAVSLMVIKDIDRPGCPRAKKKRMPLPPIDPLLQLKWGLAMLGEQRAKEYLAWLYTKLSGHDQ
jgi:hypothetical protein